MHLTEDDPHPRKFPQKDVLDLSEIKEKAGLALPAWSAEEAKSPEGESSEGRLARLELKDAIQSLIDPKFRFNIAGRDFAAAIEDSKELESDVLTLVADFFRLLIRSLNERIDRVLRRKSVRVLWAKMRRKKHVAEAIMKDIPFMVREVVLVRPDGTIAANAKRLTGDTKLSELLKSGGNGKDGDGSKPSRRAEKKAASMTFSKLSLVADANTTAERNIVYATGSRFAVAASVQGVVPRRFASRLGLTAKAIEDDLNDGQSNSRLTAAKSRRVKRYLNEILELTGHKLQAPMPWLQALGVVAVFAMILSFAAAGLNSWKEARWQELVAEIDSIPGIDITSSIPNSRPRIIAGFRDPLAADPRPIIERSGFESGAIALSLFPYRSSDPPIVEQRVNDVLSPPESVTLQLAGSVMFVSGSASHSWLHHCEQQRSFLLPQTQLDLSGVVDESLAACRLSAEKLLPQRIDFDPAGKTAVIMRDEELTRAADLIRELQKEALDSGIPLEIRLVGRHSNDVAAFGIESLRIGRDRADHVRDLLLACDPAIDPIVLRTIGERPLPDTAFDFAKRNHAVEFVISLNGEKLMPESVMKISSQANIR